MSSSELSTRSLRIICLVLIGLGMIGTGMAVFPRIHAERSVRAIELIVDYGEVAALAGKAGAPIGAMLDRCRTAGATGVALPEETLASLADAGQVSLDTGADLRGLVAGVTPEEPVIAIHAPDARINRFVFEGLRRAYPADRIHVLAAQQAIVVRGDRKMVEDIGLGLDRAKFQSVLAASLHVVPRLHASAWQTSDDVVAAIADVSALLPDPSRGYTRGLIIFDGKAVPGYPGSIGALARSLHAQSLTYGSVEFGKQRGDAELGTRLNGDFVRVHSISREELAQMSVNQAAARYALAAKDRNIRAVVIHFPQQAAGDTTDPARADLAYIFLTKQALIESGMAVLADHPARAFPAFEVPPLLLGVLFLAAIGAAGYGALLVLPERLPRGLFLTLAGALAVIVVAAAALALRKPDLGRTVFGLTAGLAFPMLGLTAAYRGIHRLADERGGRAWLTAMLTLTAATIASLLGGLVIAGMMSETRYLVRVEQFTGVKLTLVGPLLALGVLAVFDAFARPEETWRAYLTRAMAHARAFFANPITIGGALLVVVALAAVALLVVRSGNDAAGAVSGLELKLRYVLEQVLVARPRTKEFLIGHPMFILAFLAAARGHRGIAVALLLGGAVGQADVLNTYCHAHTPVTLSVLRTLNGLWIGALLGSLLMLLSARHVKAADPAEPVTV
jgi:hypothetical protein